MWWIVFTFVSLVIGIALLWWAIAADRKRKQFLDFMEEQLASKLPRFNIARKRRFGFKIRTEEGKELELYFGELFKTAFQDPIRFEAELNQYLDQVQKKSSTMNEQLSWGKVQDFIYPMLKPRTFLFEISKQAGTADVLFSMLDENVVITYVIDLKGAVGYIFHDHLHVWNVDEEHVKKLALENLLLKTQSRSLNPAQKLIVVREGDGFDAARLLIAHKLIEKPDEHIFAAIPERDVLILAWLPNPKEHHRLSKLVLEHFVRTGYPLSVNLYRYTPDGFVPFDNSHA